MEKFRYIVGGGDELGWARAVEKWSISVLVRNLVGVGDEVLVLTTSPDATAEDAHPLFEDVMGVRLSVMKWDDVESTSHAETSPSAKRYADVACFRDLQSIVQSGAELRRLLDFVARVLVPGGFFFGTVTDSAAIWTLAQKEIEVRESQKRRGYVHTDDIRLRRRLFELRLPKGEIFRPIGSPCEIQYRNADPSARRSSEFLVHFATLVDAAREVGLRVVEADNLRELWDHHRKLCHDLLERALGDEFASRPLPFSTEDYEALGLLTSFVFVREPD